MKIWLLVCLCLHAAQADNPGVQVSLTEDTLNSGLFTFYAFYLTSASFFIGDFNYALKTIFGEIDLNITNINITSVSLDYQNSVFSLESPNILTYTIMSLEVDATADYDIKAELLHLDPGHALVKLSATNATVSIALSSTLSKPQIHFQNVELKFGDIALTTQLPKVFNDLIAKEIHDQAAGLDKTIASLASSKEASINALLESLDLVVSCPVEPLAVDLGLVLGPQVLNNSILVVGLNGTMLIDGVAVPSDPAVSVPIDAAVSEGLQVALTDFFVDSALQSVWSGLSYTINSLPASLGVPLTTDTLSLLVPQLRMKYGSGKAVKLTLYTTSNNSISYRTDSNFLANFSIFINSKVNVTNEGSVNATEEWADALTLGIDASVNMGASLTNNAVNVSVASIQVSNVTLESTEMENVNVGVMMTLINQLLLIVVLEEMSPLLTNYVLDLPDGLSYFVNTDDMKVETGYLVLGADI